MSEPSDRELQDLTDHDLLTRIDERTSATHDAVVGHEKRISSLEESRTHARGMVAGLTAAWTAVAAAVAWAVEWFWHGKVMPR